MLYSACFDVRDGRNGFGVLTLKTLGKPDIAIDLSTLYALRNDFVTTTTVFNHVGMNIVTLEDGSDGSAAIWDVGINALEVALTNAMQVAATSYGWADTAGLAAIYSASTHNYGFVYPGHAFTAIQFSNGATRKLFGFAADFSGLSDAEGGTVPSNFIIEPVLTAVTTENVDGYIYEPKGISAAAPSPSGMQYGLARGRAPIFRDWTQQSEPRAKTLRGAATAAHPCTHQQLFESCRSVYPFIVIDGFGDGFDYAFRLRPEGAMWTTEACVRAGGDMDDALFDIHYRAFQLGSVRYEGSG
jgi:hypothetical protein